MLTLQVHHSSVSLLPTSKQQLCVCVKYLRWSTSRQKALPQNIVVWIEEPNFFLPQTVTFPFPALGSLEECIPQAKPEMINVPSTALTALVLRD